MIDELREIIPKSPLKGIIGQVKPKRQIKSALIMGRNVVIVGPPGIGKTTLAKEIASLLPEVEVMDCGYNCFPEKPICPKCISGSIENRINIKGGQRFVRIQGSPDLTAEDLLGDIDPVMALKHGPMSLKAFTPGKIFRANNGVLFFDELNRCPEKLQNTLLQVLEERKATIAGYSVDFDINFIFIGTMNPEDTSTERLSDVFLDRFDIVYMSYPEDVETEKKIVETRGKKLLDFPEDLLFLSLEFINKLRCDSNLEKKPSVRASIGLYERAQANAYLEERKRVNFNDIKESVISVLSHRLRLKPSKKYVTTTRDYITEMFSNFVKDKGDVP